VKPTPSPTPSSSVSLGGTWRVGAGSTLGYGTQASVGFVSETVTGRTTGVTGQSTVADWGASIRISDSTFTADLTRLHADNPLYDAEVASALDAAHYPTSTFVQSGQVTVARSALAGGTAVTLRGQMTFHGVTRAVSFSGQASYSNGRFRVAGTADFRLADFGFSPNLGLISLADTATLDFALVMGR